MRGLLEKQNQTDFAVRDEVRILRWAQAEREEEIGFPEE
jgi:hypothetical protein